MKTLEQIIKDYKDNTLDGRQSYRFAQFLTFDKLAEFGFELKEGVTKEEYNKSVKPFTRVNVLAQLEKDVTFGFEKALDRRGLSSSMMFKCVKFWNDILEEGLENWDDNNYSMYRLPLFKAPAVKYRWNNPIGDDYDNESTMVNMNEEINLCKILKDCPKETELYSPMYGKVYFNCIFYSDKDSIIYCYKTKLSKGCTRAINSQCTDIVAFYNNGTTGNPDFNTTSECMLFFSKDQRDWSKFTAPWYKKKKFDPYTLKPFDKVLVRDDSENFWRCDHFSHIDDTTTYKYCTSFYHNFCIPYNEETKYLVGTKNEAPEYYRYWEE